tara:strand:+ start:286 stop:447 length:162 start_codon:yes stop_codon:yes gene_type:complete
MYFIGESKPGPYLTLTLLFFKDKKISSALEMEKKHKEKIIIKIFLKKIFLNIF